MLSGEERIISVMVCCPHLSKLGHSTRQCLSANSVLT